MTVAVNRRGLRLAVIALLVAVAVIAAGRAALPEVARRLTAWRLAVTTGRAVTIDAVELALFRGHVAVGGVRVIDHDGGPLATLARLEARISWRALLRGRLHLTDGALDGLALRIVRLGPQAFNVSDLLTPTADPDGAPAVATTVDRFTARNVDVVVEDRTVTPARTWRAALEAEAQDVSARPERGPGTASLRGTVAGAPLSVTVTELRLAPLRMRATFAVREVDAALASLALPPSSALSPVRGTVTASGTLAHDDAGSLVALEVGVRDIELRRYNTTFLAAPAVRITVEDLRVRPDAVEVGRVEVDGGSVTLADMQLGTARRWTVDGLALEVRNVSSARDAPAGTATGRATMAGASVSLWAAQMRLAPLELHATTIIRNVDLAVVRASLPPALPVRPERGVVNATLQIDHDEARGTNLDLDATVSGVELHRAGHVVTAPAVRVLADDVALHGDVVTVGVVTARSDRLTLEERIVTPARRWVMQNVSLDAKSVSSRTTDTQGVATLEAAVGGATLAAWVTQLRLDPLQFHLTTSLRDFDLTLVDAYLPPEALVDFTGGRVNAAVEVHHTAADGTTITGDATLTGMEARGQWALSTLRASAPSLRVTLADVRRHADDVRVGRIEVSGQGALVDSGSAASRLEFSHVRLASEGLTWPVHAPARVEVSARFGDRGELDASGTAMLTAPLPAIGWSTELALAFRRVDLAPLAAYVPAARGVGGRVRAKLTANVAYSGGALSARVRGDVAGGRFALADGDRTALTLRGIDATGLDVRWPERIAIDQVRLREPSAVVERDRQGRFPLLDRFAPAPAADAAPTETAATAASPDATRGLPPITIGEVVIERGRALLVDAAAAVPARIDVPRIDLTARDVAWPTSSTPMRVVLDAGLPGGGTAKAEGTVIAEPASVDLKVALANAELEALQAYLPFRADVRARVDATVTVAGPLAPTPRLSVRGEAGVRALAIADGTDPLITVERIRVTGIDATWPERVTLDHVLVRRSWALIERDAQGQFVLRALLERTPSASDRPAPATPAPTPGAPAPPAVALTVRELVLEQQGATIVDAVTTPAARFDVAGARLSVNDLTWPSRGPMTIDLATPMPGGGRMELAGALEIDPLRLDARAVLDTVALAPVQPYLPIEGTVAGQVSGELAVKVAVQPLRVQVSGQSELRRFRLNDGDRPVVTVGRVDLAGIDVDWPRRLGIERVLFRRPRLLVERDALGRIRLWEVAVPSWNGKGAASGSPPAPSATPAATPAAPVIEVAGFRLEKASARFVDQSTTPTYAEELSNVEMTVTPLTTAPGGRSRFTASGAVGGGTFAARGEAATGDPTRVALNVEVRDYVVPRANPYLDLYTGWIATRGSLSATGVYTVTGTRLETRHDLVVRDLEVAPVDTRDEVERRVGLPFGLLVSLLKDAHGAITLSVPVTGDLSRREFDFHDAVWSAVRALALRLVALPFSRIGSLFVSEDSKVEAVAITPVEFQPGTSTLGAGMDAHLQKIARFLRDAPEVTLALQPIFTQADVDALKDGAADPVDAMRALGEHRLGAVREALTRAGVTVERLPGRVARRPLIEAGGAARVELNPRVPEAVDAAPRGG